MEEKKLFWEHVQLIQKPPGNRKQDRHHDNAENNHRSRADGSYSETSTVSTT